MCVHPFDQIGRGQRLGWRPRRNDIGVHQVHGNDQSFTRRIGVRFRRGKSPGETGADIKSWPKEGTFANRSHSLKPKTTASRLPWRVMIAGLPRTASSTTDDRVALASFN